MAGHITSFEIYGDDPEALAAFYRGIFGWRIDRVEGVDYWRISLDAAPATIANGGIARRPAFGPKGWMNFVEVERIDDAIAAAPGLGGTVIKEKTAVPRTGWHAVIADPAGNPFLVWQPDPLAFPPPEPD